MSHTIRTLAVVAATTLVLAFAGACGTSDDAKHDASPMPQPIETEQTTGPADEAEETDQAGDGCWVHLYEEENFDERDDNFRLTEPGNYENLDALPGATKNWTDEADSIKVGPNASVEIWTQRDFKGYSQMLAPGFEDPDLDEEPSSLVLKCH